jgi:hypothetical protein
VNGAAHGMPGIHAGMSLEEAKTVAQRFGAKVELLRATGHVRFSHSMMTTRRIVHDGRADAPIKLVAWLLALDRNGRRLREALGLELRHGGQGGSR